MQILFFKSFLNYYRIFKRYTGRKLYLLTTIIIIGGLFEGIGITLVIPLLSQASPASAKKDAISVYLYKTLDFLNIPREFNYILLLITAAFIIKAVIVLIQQALNSRIRARLIMNLRKLMLSGYTDMKYSYYLNCNIGYLNNIITTEIERAVGAFGQYVLCIVSIIYIFIYAGICSIISWEISTFALLSGVVLLYSFRFLNNISRHYSMLTSEKNASLQELLIQIIHFFKYLKATSGFKKIKQKLVKEINALANYEFKLGLVSSSLLALREPIAIILLIGLIFFQVSFLGKNIAAIMVIILLFYRLLTRVFQLQSNWQKFNSNVGGIDTFVKAFENINKNLEIKGTKNVINFSESINFENINFSFGDKQILFDINMTIPKNRIIAIVGESGSGKSTVADLITGLLRPATGKIYFDGIDYEDIDLESIRSLMGYVTQENIVFHDSIANNISLWRCHSSESLCRSKVHKAAEAAHCYEFVKDTEEGYQTIIGDRGIKLSGGQRQRLSIARELFKEPEILILDEATSSLDSESESFIQNSIDNLKGSKTVIVIAHRLSTIKNCDYVYVLNKGRIVEEGIYEELYKENTKFRKMCLEQKL